MFDKDGPTIQQVKKRYANATWAGAIKCHTMENYPYKDKDYDLIVFRWCVAYLEDEAMISVFHQARHGL